MARLKRIKDELLYEKDPNSSTCRSKGLNNKPDLLPFLNCVKITQDNSDDSNSILLCHITIDPKIPEIPSHSPYANCEYKFSLNLGPHYPFKPPKITCLTDVYHMSIDPRYDTNTKSFKNAHICFSDGKMMEFWSPTWTVRKLMYQILFLFVKDASEVDYDMTDRHKVWKTDRLQYNLNIVKVKNDARSDDVQKKLIDYYSYLKKRFDTMDCLIKHFHQARKDILSQFDKDLSNDVIELIIQFADGKLTDVEYDKLICTIYKLV